jgi:hypothetical protein
VKRGDRGAHDLAIDVSAAPNASVRGFREAVAA